MCIDKAKVKAKLSALFGDKEVDLYCYDNTVKATVYGGQKGVSFTYDQMEALPDIFGTIKLNFSNSFGNHSSWGTYTNLVITALYKE